MAEEGGLRCLYVSGAATANRTLGLPDTALVTVTEMADWTGRVARAVEVPAIPDAHTGYVNVMRTVELFQKEGLAGMHVEDHVSPSSVATWRARGSSRSRRCRCRCRVAREMDPFATPEFGWASRIGSCRPKA